MDTETRNDLAKQFDDYARSDAPTHENMAAKNARIAELEAENENLRTVMIAAAEEIKLHWEAHCDPVEGMGPVNLLRRLECGIPAEYGYKAGSFRRLMYRVKALEAALAPFADAADHIPEEAEMLDVDYMLDGKVESESVAFEGVAFHRARALLEES